MKDSKEHYIEGTLLTTDNTDKEELIKLTEKHPGLRFEDNKLIVRQSIPKKLFNELKKTLNVSIGCKTKE